MKTKKDKILDRLEFCIGLLVVLFIPLVVALTLSLIWVGWTIATKILLTIVIVDPFIAGYLSNLREYLKQNYRKTYK